MRSTAISISLFLVMGIMFGAFAPYSSVAQSYGQRGMQQPGMQYPAGHQYPGGSNNTANQYGDLGTIGGNPFQSQDGDQNQDTTKRPPKIRKPLESYLFDDSTRARPNFSWYISTLRNEIKFVDIDTSLNLLQIDYPYFRKGVGDAYQGNLGGATIPLNYFDRPNYADRSFAQAFDVYYFTPENAPFYNVKKPYTQLNYFMSGQKKYYEENLGVIHAQNISPSSGFNLNYKSRGTRGRYQWQKARDKNLSIAFSHTGKKYTIHAGYIYNAVLNKENGGIENDRDVTDTIYDLTDAIPVRLHDARNQLKDNTYYVMQSYGIPLRKLTDEDFSIADRSSLFFGHSFQYSRWSRIYTDTYEKSIYDTDVNYYDNWFINPKETRDSVFESLVANRLFVQIQPWDRNGVVGLIDGGVGMDNHYYYQFVPQQLITGKGNHIYRTDYYAYGGIKGKIKKFVDWGGNAMFYPAGNRKGDMNIGADLALSAFIKGKPITLSGRFYYDRKSPDFWRSNYFSNHYIWSNSFDKENETRIEATLSVPSINLEISAWQSIVKNKIYYGPDCLPAQHGGNVSVTGVYARKDFRAGGFHFNHRVLLQWSTSQEVIPVPMASAYLFYYFEFNVVKNVLRLQTGIDGRYNTKYYAFGYNPATASFYNQREKEYGEYPMIDLFVNAKWKRMRILLKLEHLTEDMLGTRNYFTLLHYPQNRRVFKIGFSWSFYD